MAHIPKQPSHAAAVTDAATPDGATLRVGTVIQDGDPRMPNRKLRITGFVMKSGRVAVSCDDIRHPEWFRTTIAVARISKARKRSGFFVVEV